MQIEIKNITLLVNGRYMTFSEKQLIDVLEDHFNEVNPNGINQSDFQEARKDHAQENLRQCILEALKEAKRDPDRYGRSFTTRQPERTWDLTTVDELIEIAEKNGDHIADWVEWYLQLAQQIINGEKWEDICNKADLSKCCRLIQWKDGNYRCVGGACEDIYDDECVGLTHPSASSVDGDRYCMYDYVSAVPLVVVYR